MLVPMSGALKPVEDVGAAGVVDLVEGVSVGLLHRHGIAAERTAGGRLPKNTIKSLTHKPTHIPQMIWIKKQQNNNSKKNKKHCVSFNSAVHQSDGKQEEVTFKTT